MNICFFLISDGWGGAENVVYHLAKFMVKKGHNVNVILNDETYSYFKNLEKVEVINIGPVYSYRKILETNFNIFIHSKFLKIKIINKVINIFLGKLVKYMNYRRIKNHILKIVNEKDPDILHFHNPFVLDLYSHIFHYLKCPVIYTAHGKHKGGFKKRNLIKSFDRITAVSDHTKKYLETQGILSAIHVIYNGLDMNNINALNIKNKHDGQLNEKQFILFFPGGMKANKGGMTLLKAMKILNLKNLPIKLYYLGETSTNFVKKNKTRNVEFFGFLPHNEYLKKLNDSDCFVLLSAIEEFPISVVEAMALGKAIITTPVGGVPEFCLDGRNALFVERNLEELAEKIIYLYRNHKIRMQISKNNVQDAKRFDWNTITDKYIELYQSAIQ